MTTTTHEPAIGIAAAGDPVGTAPTAVPGLLLRPVRWPEDARTLAEVNNASQPSVMEFG